MSVAYYFDIEIVVQFNKRYLFPLVDRLIDMGFDFPKEDESRNLFSARYLSSEEILSFVLGENDEEAYIPVKYHELLLVIFLEPIEKGEATKIHFDIVGNRWERSFLNQDFESDTVDHGRCVRLLLEIASGYDILSLNAYTRL